MFLPCSFSASSHSSFRPQSTSPQRGPRLMPVVPEPLRLAPCCVPAAGRRSHSKGRKGKRKRSPCPPSSSQLGPSILFFLRVQHFGRCFIKDFIYLFLERGREGEGEGEKHGVSLVQPQMRTCLHPKHVPWPGFEPATFQFAGRHSTH